MSLEPIDPEASLEPHEYRLWRRDEGDLNKVSENILY